MLRTTLPVVTLVVIVTALALGAGYYLASAGAIPPSVTWSVNPLFINFSSQIGSGSSPDSFTCSPPVAPVTLKSTSNQPSIITLTVTPSSFSSCGSTPDNILVTATCTPVSQANNTCSGDFSGMVVVCGPTPYTCLKRTLIVVITVTDGE